MFTNFICTNLRGPYSERTTYLGWLGYTVDQIRKLTHRYMMTSRRHFSKMTLLSVCFGLFMIQLDLTVVNVALKSIQDNLHADVAALQWVVDAYAILFSSLMLTTGDLGDIFGRRRIYTSGIVLFVLGSIACASAPSDVF